MLRTARRILPAVILLGSFPLAFAGGPAIGLVVADGSFEVDRSRIWGNATLFDGDTIETNVASSQLRLHRGVTLRLAAESRARVYESRLVLEKGIGQLESVNYRIEAASLRVTPDAPGASARVQLTAPNRVVVAAREGSVRVTSSEGILIAKLDRGGEMAFEPAQGGASAVTRVSGVLTQKDGQFILLDRTTHITFQLHGDGLESEVGKLVEITGTAESTAPTAAGASQVIAVTSLKHLAQAAAAAGSGGAGAAGSAAGATAAGISTGATVAIVGGVAAAGTLGGLAAAGALPGQGESKPSISR